MFRYLPALAHLFVLFFFFGTSALAVPDPSSDDCEEYSELAWTDQECWAWKQIRSGEAANADLYPDSGADTLESDEVTADREFPPTFLEISPNFIETLIGRPQFYKLIPKQGVRFVGARFRGPIDLSGMSLAGDLWLDESQIDGWVNLSSFKVTGSLTMENTSVDGRLVLTGAVIGNYLTLSDLEVRSQIIIAQARISEDLLLTDLHTKGDIILDSTVFGRSLYIHGVNSQSLNLYSARISGEVEIVNVEVQTFDGRRIRVGGSFAFTRLRAIGDVDIRNARVDGNLQIIDANIAGEIDLNGSSISGSIGLSEIYLLELDLTGAQIGGSFQLLYSTLLFLSLQGASVETSAIISDTTIDVISASYLSVGNVIRLERGSIVKIASLFSANISGDAVFRELDARASALDLSYVLIGGRAYFLDVYLFDVDLTGAAMSEIRLGSENTAIHWSESSSFSLGNVEVTSIYDTPDSWPKSTFLNGLVYENFYELKSDAGESALRANRLEWFENWLPTDCPLSSQPYIQLASAFRSVSEYGIANHILYTARERERNCARSDGDFARWLALSALKVTIGYGYGYRIFVCLFWVAGFVALGSLVLSIGRIGKEKNALWIVFCSFDLLLPLVELDKNHSEQTNIMRHERYYFFFHKIFGYLIGFFFVAGLSGLTRI